MARDALAKFAIDRARGIVAPDGELELKDVRDNIAFVRYRAQKPASECAQCAVGPEDLKMFLQDIFHTSAPHIRDFDIEFVEFTG